MTKMGSLALSLSLLVGGLNAVAKDDTGRDGYKPRGAHGSVATGIFSFSLPSALEIDIAHETVTLPLYKGRTRNGTTFWYVVTESSNEADARRRGVNYANKMLNALRTAAVQEGGYHNGTLIAEGTVNFGLKHVLVPGPNGFPPLQFAPGAVGDAA